MIDLEAELVDALALWRKRRSAQLAAVIDQISGMFEAVLPPIEGKTRAARYADWMHRNRRKQPKELPALLAGVATGTSIEATAQLEKLCDWPADPRITALAVRLLEKPPYATSSGTQKVWRRLFELVEVHADPRAAGALSALPMNKIFRAGARGQAMRDRAANVIAKLERDSPLPPLHPDDAARAARIAAATATGLPLLAQLRKNPRDDQTRLVYTDWLLERGYKLTGT